ncbi:unnamed protein product, partial [Nesidiocoris tenuis]
MPGPPKTPDPMVPSVHISSAKIRQVRLTIWSRLMLRQTDGKIFDAIFEHVQE